MANSFSPRNFLCACAFFHFFAKSLNAFNLDFLSLLPSSSVIKTDQVMGVFETVVGVMVAVALGANYL